MLYSVFKAQVGVAFMCKQNFGQISKEKIQASWHSQITNIASTHDDVV
jgi:hypothetical protein